MTKTYKNGNQFSVCSKETFTFFSKPSQLTTTKANVRWEMMYRFCSVQCCVYVNYLKLTLYERCLKFKKKF